MSDAAVSMDRIYRWQTGFYDLTRRYFLLGRERVIEELSPAPGACVLEVGCGTGRNLIKAARRWPQARFHGIDISQVMLSKARQSLAKAGLAGRIRLAVGDATNFDAGSLFPETRFSRIFFSYTLSMIPNWTLALDYAASLLPPGGAVLVVDFGDQQGMPSWFRRMLRAWLDLFHVSPRDDLEQVLQEIAARRGMECDFVPLHKGYAFLGALRRPSRGLR